MFNDIQQAIDGLRVPRERLRFRDAIDLRIFLERQDGLDWRAIGRCRNGQEMFGIRLGAGDRHVSVIAGCHPDEPIGPMTAQFLPEAIQGAFPALLDEYTFHIVPQMNPDGADKNRPWFATPPDFVQYAQHVLREAPGDDIEFNFGDQGRPENRAAMEFLKNDAPYDAHFSLHGMAVAEGAWCLICQEWADRAKPVMAELEAFYKRMLFPLHDVDRHGEKGFHRIRKGFATTPRSDAMKEYFMAQDDPDTAAKFLPSSMEWIESLGGDPLCMVSELPLFCLGVKSKSLDQSVTLEFTDKVKALRAAPPENLENALSNLAFAYELGPVPVQFQVRAQIAMIALALQFRLGQA